MTKWVSSPTVRDVDVVDPTDKVSGKVEVSFIRAGYASVDTDAQHNDNKPAVKFRKSDWIVHVTLARQSDGTWVELEPVTYGVSQRGAYGSGDRTPPTYRAAIVAALCHTVAAQWTPEQDKAAEYAYANQRLSLLEERRAKVAAELAKIDEEMAPYLKIVQE